MRVAQHNAQYLKLLVHQGYSTLYYAQNNSPTYEMLANEILTLPGGALVFQAGYHPHKRTFKTHPEHVFFRYEKRH